MRKSIYSILALAVVLLPTIFVYAANQSVQVTAVVGTLNHAPVVDSVTPAGDPRLLAKNALQNYTLYFRDDEKDTVYYTITPASGYSNVVSGTIHSGDYDSSSGAYINFTYLAPASVPATNPTSITVTLNDGPNLVNKDLHVYVY